jgi:hypothetical protein
MREMHERKKEDEEYIPDIEGEHVYDDEDKWREDKAEGEKILWLYSDDEDEDMDEASEKEQDPDWTEEEVRQPSKRKKR